MESKKPESKKQEPAIFQNEERAKASIELLKFIYSNVNDQTKFAESKNGALIILNSGLIFGYLSILPYEPNNCPLIIFIYSIIFVFFNVVAIFISLLSLIPILSKIPQTEKPDDGTLNILFFDHLTGFSEKELVRRTNHDLNIQESDYDDPICLQLAQQIIVNSGITKRKYCLFKKALWSTIFGLFTPIIGVIILFIVDRKQRGK
jgi:hypothetical protein